VEGFPLGGFWQRPVTFADANGNGIIEPAEVTVSSTFQFVGTPFPSHGAYLTPTLTFKERVSLTGVFDYRAGHHLYNLTEEFRCSVLICRGINDRSAPSSDKAYAMARLTTGTSWGYIEKADFLKLREVSLSYTAPAKWASLLGASSLRLTVAGRNLAQWTSYSGFDPEINSVGQSNFTTSDFLTQPPVRHFTVRLNATF
jgi:hypothetical protein